MFADNTEKLDLLLDIIIQKLTTIESRLAVLENKTTHLVIQSDNSTQNMNQHINFIHQVYNNIKYPFQTLLSYISPSSNPPIFIEVPIDIKTHPLYIDS